MSVQVEMWGEVFEPVTLRLTVAPSLPALAFPLFFCPLTDDQGLLVCLAGGHVPRKPVVPTLVCVHKGVFRGFFPLTKHTLVLVTCLHGSVCGSVHTVLTGQERVI